MTTQNAYTITRHLRELATHARTTDFTSKSQDTALSTLVEWLSETRTREALDAWIEGKREGVE